MSRVGLVVVSHSALLAAGVVEVAAQMAPNVTVIAAGGTAEGGIGTDYEAVTAAIERADTGAGAVVLYDLGSARMVAEMAVEMADNARLADAPLIEGAVAAAVSAEGGADITEVAHTAEDAATIPGTTPQPNPSPDGTRPAEPAPDEAGPDGTAPDGTAPDGTPPVGPRPEEAPSAGIPPVDVAGGTSVATGKPPAEAMITLTNEIGLHARPAAVVARAMTGFDATVTIHFNNTSADARSVLAVMALGARGGDQIRVTATGPQSTEALTTLESLATNNFGD